MTVPDDGRILFFARDRAEFGFLSHFYPAPILLDGETWPTVEHYYQTQKSWEPAYRRAIRACETPGQGQTTGGRPASYFEAGRAFVVYQARQAPPPGLAGGESAMSCGVRMRRNIASTRTSPRFCWPPARRISSRTPGTSRSGVWAGTERERTGQAAF